MSFPFDPKSPSHRLERPEGVRQVDSGLSDDNQRLPEDRSSRCRWLFDTADTVDYRYLRRQRSLVFQSNLELFVSSVAHLDPDPCLLRCMYLRALLAERRPCQRLRTPLVRKTSLLIRGSFDVLRPGAGLLGVWLALVVYGIGCAQV